ncbi:MAG: hypothetical protein OXF93_13160 [Acidobacteria bacterium]|nr:hypothetical protein [Acidobacteriota bacterium]
MPGALEEIVGRGLPFEGPRLVRGLIHLFQGPEAVTARDSAATFRRCLDELQVLRSRWLGVEREAGEVSLRAAGRPAGRAALEDFLDLLGLYLAPDGRALRVVPRPAEAHRRAAAARADDAAEGAAESADPEGEAQPGCDAGAARSWRSEDVEQRLNAGQAIAWDLPHFVIALPLTPRAWLEVLYPRESWDDAGAGAEAAERAAGMLARLATDSDPARLFAGLSALDAPTLAWLGRTPRLEARLYAEHLAAFADYARAFRVRDGEVDTPGGAESVPFWQDLVGASVDEPERFADRLFGRPHVAYAYDVVARLPAARQRFVLGTWRSDARARRDGLRSLRQVFRGLPAPAPWFAGPAAEVNREKSLTYGTHRNTRSGGLAARVLAYRDAQAASGARRPVLFGWDPPLPVDPADALRAVAVDDSGAPLAPASLDFWTQVFSGEGVPEERDVRVDRIDPRPRIDAAYLIAAGVAGPAGAGRARLQAVAFAQRVFSGHAADETASVFVAVRAFARYPMLMLAVERMGVADPGVYAALAHAALRVERIGDGLERRRALSLFQGALALVERAGLAGTLAPDAAERVLRALAEAVRPVRGGGFGGALAGWLAGRLLPELGIPGEPALGATAMDDALLAALAGAGPGVAPGPLLEWEGLRYRYDPAGAALERLRRTRAQLGSNRLDTILAVAGIADQLAAGAGAAEAWAAALETLERSTDIVRNPYVGLPGVTVRVSSYANEVGGIVDDLREAVERRRADRLRRPARELRRVVDVLLADLLRTLAYVVHLANAYGTDLLGHDVAARHDFGAHIEEEALRGRAAWLPPWGGSEAPYPFGTAAVVQITEEDAFGAGWRIYGSLLSLDLAFSRMALAATGLGASGGALAASALTTDDRRFLSLAVTLFDARAASAAGPARIAAALRRGRERVRGLAADPAGLDELADAAGLFGPRRNELRWALARRPQAVERGFTLGELFWLGLERDAGDGIPAGWGAPGMPRDGCLCVRLARPHGVDVARAGPERLAATYVDLQLVLAEAVDHLGLPARIVRDLLPFAVADLLDGVEAASTGDVGEALTRYAHGLSRPQVEDYVAMQVGRGLPLRAPEEPAWR